MPKAETSPAPSGQRSSYVPQPPRGRRPGPDHRDEETADAVFVGGPRDGTPFHAGSPALVLMEIGGLVHRYVCTTTQRRYGDRDLLVYRYDGEVRDDEFYSDATDDDEIRNHGDMSRRKR